MTLHRGPERLHLREDARVERGDALCAVHAIDHVVEILRAEDHLERRCLIRRIERDEALRDRALALVEVALRDPELMTVLAQVVLNPCQLRIRRVVLRAGTLERVRKLLQLPHDLLRLCSLRRDRRVRKCRDCRQEGKTDPCENVRRLPQPTNNNPQFGGGTGAPGGAGTSRGGRLAMCSDHRQRVCRKPARNLFISARSTVVLLRHCGTVLPRARAGTNAATAHDFVRRDRGGGVDRTVGWWRKPVADYCVAACARCCDHRQVARGGARSLFARPAARRRSVEARVAPRSGTVASPPAPEPAPSARGREARHAHLPGTRGRAAARPLRGGQRRAARDRARLEEPR